MKPVRRWVFTILAGISLAICVLSMAMSVRSYWVADWIGWYEFDFNTSRGDIVFGYMSHEEPIPLRPKFAHRTGAARSYKRKSLWGVQPGLAPIGFAYNIVTDPKWQSYSVMVPLWFIALIAAALPARWVWLYRGRWRRERRQEAGLCPQCGYDLRATPELCPECGEAVHGESSPGV